MPIGPRAHARGSDQNERTRFALCFFVGFAILLFGSFASAQTETESLPLGPATDTGPAEVAPAETDPEQSAFELGGAARTVLSLGFVVGLAILAGAGAKKLSKGRGGLLGSLGPGGPSPSGVLEIMGRYPVGSGQTLVLLRLDRRLLLLHQTTGRRGAQMRTLCEVTDADEVASILLKTREAGDESVHAGFREAMHRLEREFSSLDDRPTATRATEPTHRSTQRNDEGDRAELLGEPEVDRGDPADVVTLRARLHSFIEGARA
ncbi:MAG: hypothetical protein K8E66_12780 [Phycisphaerales bacterium]|nr:hypothetical protein [Phycisphaerales bacterium]